MKVVAGRLTDADRALIAQANGSGRRVLIATTRACVEWEQALTGPRSDGPMQAVGFVTTWDHDHVWLGSWSFRTRIAWADIVGVWWRDEAPPEAEVAELIEREEG